MMSAKLGFWMFVAGAAYVGGAVATHNNAEHGQRCVEEKHRGWFAPVMAGTVWPILIPIIGVSALVGGDVKPFVCDREFARPKP